MQRICQFGLLVAIFAVGCAEQAKTPHVPPGDTDKKINPRAALIDTTDEPKKGNKPPATIPISDKTGDDILAALPEPTRKEMAEAQMLKAVELIAQSKYEEALQQLEEAQKLDDSGPIQREITKVQTIIAQREAAAKAVGDVKSVLEDGKPYEAAKLAAEALGAFGGGEEADALTRLAQQAEAEVTAASLNLPARALKLKTDANTALEENNLRAASIALEQVQSIAPVDELGKKLDELRDKLRIYDEARAKASELRREPGRILEAVEHLERAAQVWSTLQIRQQIDEFRSIAERQRDRLSVAPFEIHADLGFAAAGQTISDELLPHFKRRFDLVERGQLSRIADEMKLETASLFGTNTGRRELGALARIRYLVVGSVSPVSGITVQARLVEVGTGLIVQTARVSAATLDELLPKLQQLAVMLQMNDDEKAAYEVELQRKVPIVTALAGTPITEIPPPPPPPLEETIAKVQPLVTTTVAPIPLGGIVIEDFNRLPPPVVITALAPPLPPPPLVVALEAHPERRNRMLSLSLSLGDNLFRRGRIRDAHRHFSLALTLAGPRREIALRLDACRTYAPPPPPPVVVVPPPVVVIPPPVVITPVVPVLPPPPVVIVAPVRPRLAVFGFVPGRPTLVPPGATDLLADQLASYMGGSYEIIDRGEVCWYMGRLGLTMREVLNDPVARRCLAQSLNARYFVFGTLRETASFDVDTHLFDTETNQRTATANMHVKDHNELKLRLGELARQLGAKPEDKKAIAAAGAASEKALNDARALLTTDPAAAAKVARAGLTDYPDSVALRSLVAQADRLTAQSKLKADRASETTNQAAALALAKQKQTDLALATTAARQKAQAEAKARTEAEKLALAARRTKAAESLRSQAKTALARGDSAAAVKLYQNALSLNAGDDVFKELAIARAKAEEDAKAAKLAAQRAIADKAAKDREAIQARLDAAKAKREADAKAQKEAKDAHDRLVSANYLKGAVAEFEKKQYARAMELAQSAQRVLPSDEAGKLYADAQHALALEKADAAERAKLAAEQKKAAEAEALLKKKQDAYAQALTRATSLVGAGKYAEAEKEYEAAGKLFKTPVVAEGLKAVTAMATEQKKAAEAAKLAQEAERTRATRITTLTATAAALAQKGDHAGAVKAYKEALVLRPGDVDLLASLSRAETNWTRDQERLARIAADKKAKTEAVRLVAAGKDQLAAKRYDAAADLFRRALVQDATNAEAKVLFAQAEKLVPRPVDPVVKKKKDDYDLAMTAGRAALAKDNFKGAINAFSEALRVMPGDTVAGKALADAEARSNAAMLGEKTKAYESAMKAGSALLDGKKFKEAVAAFDNALKLRPGDPAATSGKARAEAALVPMPDPRRTAYNAAIAAAAAAEKTGKYAEALKQYDAALTAVPNDKAALEAKGNLSYRLTIRNAETLLEGKKYKEALAAFDLALKFRPGDAAALNGRKAAEAGLRTPPPPPANPKQALYEKAMLEATAAYKTGKYAEALQHTNEALKAMPDQKAALDLRAAATVQMRETAYAVHLKNGAAFLAAKKYAEAFKEYDEALKIKPGDATAINGKKMAAAALKPPEPPKPIDPLAEFKRQFDQALGLEKSGQYGQALGRYQAALKAVAGQPGRQTEEGQAYAGIGRSQHHLKQFDEAVTAYEEALRRLPMNTTLNEAIARAKKKQPRQ